MQQNYQKDYIGIDVSKPFFDATLMSVVNHQKGEMQMQRFDNSTEGLILFKKWLKKSKVGFNLNTLLVIENTGLYHRLLEGFCHDNNLPIHIGNAAHMKWSFGITRGKNDVIDSKRICQYAMQHEDEIKANGAVPKVLTTIKDLQNIRERLIKQKNANKVHLNELKTSSDKATQKMLEQILKSTLEGLQKSISKVETEIKLLIQQEEKVNTNFKLIKTVPGIGDVIATQLICYTANFKNKISGKQLASYAGVVPFEHSSGISIKGRNRVHKMSNKKLKSTLHMAALSTLQNYPEFKDYYVRKTNEGKHPLSVLNAIKNKMLIRVVAVVNNQKPYVDNYTKVA